MKASKSAYDDDDEKNIASCLRCSRNTVYEVIKLMEAHDLAWPIPESFNNLDIERRFYLNRGANEGRKLPDFEYIYSELAKPGVTLSLLWTEYCVKCVLKKLAEKIVVPLEIFEF